MTAHIVVLSNLKDADKLQEYGAAAAQTISNFGGTLEKGALSILCGDDSHERLAVLQFPDIDTAKNWYNSDEYQGLVPLREQAMEAVFMLIEPD
jgi:uncharacterized protein (DUF1330 family)